MNKENKSCPFCGNIFLLETVDEVQKHYITCDTCWAQGPFANNAEEARKAISEDVCIKEE